MNSKILPLACLAVLLSIPARAEVDVSISADIHLGKVAPPPPPEVVLVPEAVPSGPPPWAPAHGFHRNHAYYFYPGSDVYYRPADRVWFFLDGGSWRAAATLPTSLRVDFNRAVPLTMETERPYEFHEKVRTYYPADYFVARAHVKDGHDDHGNSSHHESTDGDDGHKENGKGKDKGKGHDK